LKTFQIALIGWIKAGPPKIGWIKAGPPKSHFCFDHVNRLIVVVSDYDIEHFAKESLNILFSYHSD